MELFMIYFFILFLFMRSHKL